MMRFLPLVVVLFILSCSTAEKKDSVLFAGEIVNPSSEYVVLLKGTRVIDSAKLDGNNRFAFNLESIEDGLYHFNHEPELQYVYLEKGDSLMVRLNTLYFDESLVFSGTNEDVNNFLLELFLSDEEEEQNIRTNYYGLESEAFTNEVNKLKNDKLATLQYIKEESNLSEKAFEMANASINYNYYRYMEIYPFEHKRKLRAHGLHELPKEYYRYREHINYNDKDLSYLRPYYDFMQNHIGNLSYMTCKHACKDRTTLEPKQLHFNIHKLGIIDSLIVEKELRDNLFRNVAFNYLLKEHDSPENNKIFIDDFQKVSGNNVHIKEIENLYEGIKHMQPTNVIPAIIVTSTEDDTISLPEIAKGKKTVFYFWSATNKKHYQGVFKRVDELSKSKPGYDFIGINIRTDLKNWKGIIESSGLAPNKQFRTENFQEITEKLILYPMNKCIITDDAKIVDAFSNIYSNF